MKNIKLTIAIITFLLIGGVANSQQISGVNKHQAGITYSVDDLVSLDGVIYKSVIQNSTTPPDANWVVLTSGGDVTAALVLADNAITRGDGGGKGIQDSEVTIDDFNNISGIEGYRDTSGDLGLAGQILSSTGSSTNWIDTGLLAESGFVSYGQFSNSPNQTFLTLDVPQNIVFNSNDEVLGITHSTTVNSENFTFTQGGVYTFLARPQVKKTGGGTGSYYMWGQIDRGSGFVHIPNSTVELILSANDSDVIPLDIIMAISAGDVFRIQMQADDSGVILEGSSLAGAPAIPSMILTIFNNIGSQLALSDADGDTTIEVERTLDDDIIRFKSAGVDVGTITSTDYNFIGDLTVTGTIGGSNLAGTNTGDIANTSDLNNDGESGTPYATLEDVYSGSSVIVGSYNHTGNYDYYVQASEYIINSTHFEHSEAIFDNVTLSAAHATLDRIDVLVINDNQTFSVITGTPAANPIKPSIDNETQVELSFVLVNNNTTEPISATKNLVYDENLGDPTEWDIFSSSITVDSNHLTNPQTGTKSVEFLLANFNDEITFDEVGDVTNTFDLTLSFGIRFNNFLALNGHKIRVNIFDSSTGNGFQTFISRGNSYGINVDYTADWQTAIIELPQPLFPYATFDRITFTNLEGNASFQIDNVSINGGQEPTGTGDQTSIVDITGTKAQYDTSLTDGDFLYVGDLDGNFVPYTGATGSVDLGFNDLTADAITITPPSAFNNGQLNLVWSTDFISAGSGQVTLQASDNNRVNFSTILLSSVKSFSFDYSNLTGDGIHRNLIVPNESGTLALLSDIGGGGTPTLQEVTTAGNTTNLNIDVASVNDVDVYAKNNRSTYIGTGIVGSGNTGADNVVIGNDAGSKAGGAASGVVIGSSAAEFNESLGVVTIGYEAGKRNGTVPNSANHVVLIGNETGEFNKGYGADAIGFQTGYQNTGNYLAAYGYSASRHNEGANNTSLGFNAASVFPEDTGNTKNVADSSTDINASTDLITIVAHTFGATGTFVNLKYTTTGSVIGGFSNGGIYMWEIIDANTIHLESWNMTSNGTDTHSFTPQFVYTNTTTIGYNAQPTASNQIVLGNAGVTQVVMGDGTVLGSAGNSLEVLETTSTTLDLSSVLGNLVSAASANSAIAYTTTNLTANGYAEILINAASEPTVSGTPTPVKSKGADFIVSTPMKLVVWYDGTTIWYYFLEI